MGEADVEEFMIKSQLSKDTYVSSLGAHERWCLLE